MFSVKEVTKAILALRRHGYSSYLVTDRTGVLLHTSLETPTHHTMRFVGPKCDPYLIKLVKCSAAGCHRSSSSRAEAGRQVARE